ncbi:unnamed protein product [Protopolystoma xenopodis]|uniref:Uncharacterized protein n=1 Tax=Protopolystoma xenopodis TaxID=117903 RepID=A0A448WMG8_9PLAT|nr:unnamed protein product [Protopolystoma xenopodis]
MQRRLEAEQRQTTSRASFKCPGCQTTYTDLEVDRLVDVKQPDRLVCVYCRAEVVEEEDSASRTDARAMVAKFHQQVDYHAISLFSTLKLITLTTFH